MLCCKFTGESESKKIENHSRINKVTVISLVSPFLEHGVYALYILIQKKN